MSSWNRVVILGGSGFCGAHFAEHLAAEGLAREIVLVDLVPPAAARTTTRFAQLLAAGRISYEHGDVRAPIELGDAPIDLLVNFAAVHREPGHAREEYWGTNVPGAHHACALAERHGCNEILFASSIAPYGPSESPKDESAAPAPTTAYGASKLEAERVHREWQRADAGARRLAIVRPGVVFGPGEEGNVTRMIRALRRGRFAYVGARDVRKAGLYVGEFVHACLWTLERTRALAIAGDGAPDPGILLANLTMHPAPSVEEYVAAICEVAGVAPRVPTVPVAAAVALGTLAAGASALVGRTSTWHPERIAKLARPNAIVPRVLLDGGYEFRYTLASAMREWMTLNPRDWA